MQCDCTKTKQRIELLINRSLSSTPALSVDRRLPALQNPFRWTALYASGRTLSARLLITRYGLDIAVLGRADRRRVVVQASYAGLPKASPRSLRTGYR